MSIVINFKRGNKADLPSSGMTPFEPILATDTHELFIAASASITKPITPAVNDYTELGTTPDAGDFLIIYDIDAAGAVKVKKLAYSDLGVGADTKQLKVSSNDTTEGYLEDKVVVSDGSNSTNILELSTLNDGSDEDVQIQIDESKIDHDALLNFVAGEHFLQDQITGFATVTSGSIVAGVSLGAVTMSLGSDADGDMYYRTSNILTRLSKGSAGNILAMNGGATAPEWITAVDGGTF